jgi:hypothetical protein
MCNLNENTVVVRLFIWSNSCPTYRVIRRVERRYSNATQDLTDILVGAGHLGLLVVN